MDLTLPIRVLEAIERFGYITNSQLVDMGLSTYRMIALTTQKMAAEKLIYKFKGGIHPRLGKIEDFHVLSKKGSHLLREMGLLDGAPFSERKKPITSDFMHRKLCVELHIQLWNLLEDRYPHLLLAFWHTYFQKNGGANHSQNASIRKLQSQTYTVFDQPNQRAFIPDIIFRLQNTKTKQSLLFTVEATHSGKTKRTLQQIWRHSLALESRALGQKYQVDEPHLVLCLFTEANWMDHVQNKLNQVTTYGDSFYFNTIQGVKMNPEVWFRGASKNSYSILSLKPTEV